ncbi:MAG: double-strand break repair protein AddB, partial [Pseudomonadota bacterium]
MPRSIAPLFQSGRGDIRTIPAGADFLTELAQGLFSALANPDDPAALSRATIYLPNRRSVRALEMAFLEASGRSALMLPSIRTLGDLDRQQPVFAFEAPPDRLLPPASNAMRLGHLAQLVVAFQNSRGIPISPLSALNSAKELAGLLDQIAMSNDVDWSKLSDMLETVDLAQHWKESAQFLGIIVEQWPAFLSESGRIDPAAYQRALAESIAQIWQDTAPASPIIIAGSTGANASTRALMKAASGLPNGLIVLPGLSDTANEAENAAILSAPSHPQFTLQRTLQSLGVSPETVMNWPDVRLGEAQSARNRFVQDALAPAALTASWGQRSIDLTESGTVDDAVKAATDGLALIEAGNDTEEAELAALLLRESLQREGERTALVTLDMGLALRVSAQLKALGIDCQPSAGTPLLQTMLGSAILELAELLEDPSHPIRLISALRLPLGKFTEDSVLAFDKHVLRGPRLWKDLAGLERHANAVLSSQRCAATSDEAQ